MNKTQRHLLALARQVANKIHDKFDYYIILEDKMPSNMSIDEVFDNPYEKEYRKYVKWRVGYHKIEIDYEESFIDDNTICFRVNNTMTDECENFDFDEKIINSLFEKTDEEIKEIFKGWFEKAIEEFVLYEEQ